MSILGFNRDLPFLTIKAIDGIFSDDVTVDAADLPLASSLTAGKSNTTNGFSYNLMTHRATWNLPDRIRRFHNHEESRACARLQCVDGRPRMWAGFGTRDKPSEASSMSGEAVRVVKTQCCIVGGGPAGMVAGLLLARAGVDVLVLEKHSDFLRDFRGDTIHPSTLEVMGELGFLDEFLKRPHQEASRVGGFIGGVQVLVADFTHLPTRCRFIALMPQWDFLDFLAERARRYPSFHLKMKAEVTGLIESEGKIVGVRAKTPEGPIEVRADLTIGCDGRHSTVRDQAGLEVEVLGAPIDVLWLRISRLPTDPDQPLGRFDRGKILVMIYRGDYWQCGYIIPKGGIDAVRSAGLDVFRHEIAESAPFIADRVDELASWDNIKLLTVAVDRLRQWYRPGLLCIGDAAHAMSPIGGVGINLAIQDAVAAANLLAEPLRHGSVDEEDLRTVQKRRLLPTKLTQRLQVLAQDRILSRVLASQEALTVPWPFRLFSRFPILQRIPARLIGMGFRPEHVRCPDRWAGTSVPKS